MVTWWRVENWESDPPKFFALATQGNVLFVRQGVIHAGKRPTVERRELAGPAEADSALEGELKKLKRRKFTELTRVEGEAPSDAQISYTPTPLRANRWTDEEAAPLRERFFARLAEVGLDPSRDFSNQAESGSRKGSDAMEAQERDADARAGLCLRIAREVLNVSLGITWQQGHDGNMLADIFPSATAVFERARRTRR